MNTKTLYAVLDTISDQRLGCVGVDKSALRTNRQTAQFRTVRLTPWQLGCSPDNQVLTRVVLQGLAAYKIVQDHQHILHLLATYEDADSSLFVENRGPPLQRRLSASTCWSLSAKAVHCSLQTVRPSLNSATAAKYTSQIASAMQNCCSQGMLSKALAFAFCLLQVGHKDAACLLCSVCATRRCCCRCDASKH